MSNPEYIPEIQHYLDTLQTYPSELNLMPDGVQHAIRTLGEHLKGFSKEGLPEEQLRRRMKLEIYSIIDQHGVTVVPYLQLLGVSLSEDEIQVALDIHDFLQNKEKNTELVRVTAKCLLCPWEMTGLLQITKDEGEIQNRGSLINACVNHHNNTRSLEQNAISQHNQFDLFVKEDKRGYLAASSAVVCGIFSREVKQG
jgi:hypothetical protein